MRKPEREDGVKIKNFRYAKNELCENCSDCKWAVWRSISGNYCQLSMKAIAENTVCDYINCDLTQI